MLKTRLRACLKHTQSRVVLKMCMVAKRKQVNKQSKNLKKEPKHKIIKNLSKTEN